MTPHTCVNEVAHRNSCRNAAPAQQRGIQGSVDDGSAAGAPERTDGVLGAGNDPEEVDLQVPATFSAASWACW